MFDLRRRLLPLFLIPIILIVGGTAGYMLIEGWPWPDAFYMTAITLTTVGFGEVQPLSSNGRLFTTALIFLGVGAVAYGLSSLGEMVIDAGLRGEWRRRRVMRDISKLRDHVIVCGYGRVGRSTVETLRQNKRNIVIIDHDPDNVEAVVASGLPAVEGDATKDEVLRAAGIEHAANMVVSTGEDSLNLFVVLSARALNPNLYIVTRSVNAENESKMRRAGADRVVSPYQIGGKHMANIIVRPHVTDFLDVVTLDGGLELWLEEFVIGPSSPLSGRTVGETDIRRETGVTLVALLRREGGSTITPSADTILRAGDELIVLGTREQLAVLEDLTNSPSVT